MDKRTWPTVNLHGAGAIAKVCGVYEVFDTRIPGARFKIKVLQHNLNNYVAHLNVCLNAQDGVPDWIAGIGHTEEEALEDSLKCFMSALALRTELTDEDFEWSDPGDF